jgi:hypothetical protein
MWTLKYSLVFNSYEYVQKGVYIAYILEIFFTLTMWLCTEQHDFKKHELFAIVFSISTPVLCKMASSLSLR